MKWNKRTGKGEQTSRNKLQYFVKIILRESGQNMKIRVMREKYV